MKKEIVEEKSRLYNITYNDRPFSMHEAGCGDPTKEGDTALLLKNLPTLEGKKVTLVECGLGVIAGICSSLEAEVTTYSSNLIDKECSEKNSGGIHHFADFVTTHSVPQSDLFIFRITKAADYNALVIAKALSLLSENGALWIVGANKGGIKGVASKLKKAKVVSSVVANGNNSRILEVLAGQLFEYSYEEKETLYTTGSDEIGSTTIPGLFSYGKIDKGTTLLLKHFPKCTAKSVLDLGCGSGILAKKALLSGAKEVTATDISAMAIDATKKTVSGYENCTVLSSYIGDRLEAKYDIIVTNPPFHEGGNTNYSIGEEWLAQLDKLLIGRGEVWLVANSFLPYRSMGEKVFGDVELIIEENGFRVYKMKKVKKLRGKQKRKRVSEEEILFDVGRDGDFEEFEGLDF